MSNNTINYTMFHQSIRVETYKTGEGNRRYKFDARTPESVQKARDFANNCYKSGYKVSMKSLNGFLFQTLEEAETYKSAENGSLWESVNITPANKGQGFIAWCSTVAKVADGRPPKAPKSEAPSQSPKSKTSSQSPKSKASTEAPKKSASSFSPKKSTSKKSAKVDPSTPSDADRINKLEADVAALTASVNALVEALKK